MSNKSVMPQSNWVITCVLIVSLLFTVIFIMSIFWVLKFRKKVMQNSKQI